MPDSRVSSKSYVLLALATGGYFLYTFSWYSLAAFLVPIIEALGLSSVEAGAVTGAVQLSYIPLSLVSGLLIDRVGSRKSLAGGLFIVGVAHVLRGFSTNFVTVVVPTLLLGVGGTAVTFGLPKIVSDLFPQGEAGTMSSVYTIGATLGSATVFAVAQPVVEPLLGGWRTFFLYTGVGVMVFALVWFVVSWYLWRHVDLFSVSGDEQTFSLASMRGDLGRILTHSGLFLIVVVGTMRLFIAHGLSNWLPTILETRGMAPALAGTVTSLFIVIRILGIVSIPVVSDRLSTRRLPIITCGLAGTFGMVGLTVGGPVWVVALSLVLVGTFIIGGLSPLVRAIPIEMDDIGPNLIAVATGLIFTVGEVGGFFGPFSIGFVYDQTGSFTPALMLLAVASFVTAVAGYIMNEPGGTEPTGS